MSAPTLYELVEEQYGYDAMILTREEYEELLFAKSVAEASAAEYKAECEELRGRMEERSE